MKNLFDKQKVYELLLTIPRGKVITYGDLAQMMGNKTWARSVGNALHENPDGDKYPCYKVVNSKGELSHAYAFGGLDEQKRRLEKDGIMVENYKVNLKRYGYFPDYGLSDIIDRESDIAKKDGEKMNSWHVGVAAEAITAAQFARYGYDVSVQYGADQPEYDLIASRGDEMLKISVKGSKDGGWGLTQKFKKGHTYQEAIDEWLNKHHKKTIFCLVQFKNVDDLQLPKMYLATPSEIAERLRCEAKGRGDTILYMEHTWGPTAQAYGTTDKIPEEWLFTRERADEIFAKYAR